MAKPKFDIANLANYRNKFLESQKKFWAGIGVEQSAGSRYENGWNIPGPVALLLTLRETGKITAKDLETAKAVITKAKANK